jgi:hypothetical protein
MQENNGQLSTSGRHRSNSTGSNPGGSNPGGSKGTYKLGFAINEPREIELKFTEKLEEVKSCYANYNFKEGPPSFSSIAVSSSKLQSRMSCPVVDCNHQIRVVAQS